MKASHKRKAVLLLLLLLSLKKMLLLELGELKCPFLKSGAPTFYILYLTLINSPHFVATRAQIHLIKKDPSNPHVHVVLAQDNCIFFNSVKERKCRTECTTDRQASRHSTKRTRWYSYSQSYVLIYLSIYLDRRKLDSDVRVQRNMNFVFTKIAIQKSSSTELFTFYCRESPTYAWMFSLYPGNLR